MRKQAYGRKPKPKRGVAIIDPEIGKGKPLQDLYDRCLDFAEQNSSLALDDSFDRHRLAEEMVQFVLLLRDEIFLEIDQIRKDMGV